MGISLNANVEKHIVTPRWSAGPTGLICFIALGVGKSDRIVVYYIRIDKYALAVVEEVEGCISEPLASESCLGPTEFNALGQILIFALVEIVAKKIILGNLLSVSVVDFNISCIKIVSRYLVELSFIKLESIPISIFPELARSESLNE